MSSKSAIAPAHSQTKIAALERKIEELYLLVGALERKIQLQGDRITIVDRRQDKA